MAEEKKDKKKKKGYLEELYDDAAKSGVMGSRAKVQAENSSKQSSWFTGGTKKKGK
jgi:hypothetical protein